MSEKLCLSPSETFHMPSSRMPGMSIAMTPFFRRMSWRRVVVCLPRPSFSRMPPVSMTSPSARALIRLDFPTPDAPRNTIVLPGFR